MAVRWSVIGPLPYLASLKSFVERCPEIENREGLVL